MTSQNAGDGEALRQISQDYKTVFSSPAGTRVLSHILTKVLMTGDKAGPGPGERANYILAMHDAARQIVTIMDLDFTQAIKPNIAPRPQRFTSRVVGA